MKGEITVMGMNEKSANLVSCLVKERVRQDITQIELASRLGVPQSTISRIESYKCFPRLDTIMNIAEELGCEIIVKPTKGSNVL